MHGLNFWILKSRNFTLQTVQNLTFYIYGSKIYTCPIISLAFQSKILIIKYQLMTYNLTRNPDLHVAQFITHYTLSPP
jgi:hypothetical protein